MVSVLSAAPSARSARLPWWRALSWLVLILGAVLRLVIWLQQRSVYLDEANLIRNFTERSYAGLFRNLNYEQYAPPLFSSLVKASIQAWGNQELAVRLVPTLASILALVLFFRQTQRWLTGPAAVFALGFVAFGKIFLDYGTACKQYSTDALTTLLLLEAAYYIGRKQFRQREAALWLGIGCVSIWFSMPAVFVLAGIGVWYAVKALQQKQQYELGWVVAVGTGWLGCFGLYYMLLLKTNVESSYLQQYHQEQFLAFPPRSLEQVRLLFRQLGELVDKAIGKTALAAVLAGVCFPLGIWQLGRKGGMLAYVVLLTFLTCLGASALHYYSLMSRLVLFLLPLVVLVVAIGAQWLGSRHQYGAVLLSVLALLVLANQQQLRYLVQPFHSDYAEVRTGLEYVARHQQPQEVVFSYHNLTPVTRYYTQERIVPLQLRNLVMTTPRTTPEGEDLLRYDLRMVERQHPGRIWLVYDREDDTAARLVASRGQILQRFDFYRGYALLYQPDSAAAPL